jgi:Protein of unknown function (DUF2568)
VRAANLLIKFLIELAAVAAFAYWGASAASGTFAVLLAVAVPTAMVVIWGAFAAPNSARRLRTAVRVPLELTVFALAALALVGAGSSALALAFALLVLANAALLTLFDQWEG